MAGNENETRSLIPLPPRTTDFQTRQEYEAAYRDWSHNAASRIYDWLMEVGIDGHLAYRLAVATSTRKRLGSHDLDLIVRAIRRKHTPSVNELFEGFRPLPPDPWDDASP